MSRNLSEFSEKELKETIELAFETQFGEEDEEFGLYELRERLDNLGHDWSDWDGVMTSVDWQLKKTDEYGGEGQGDEYWYVFSVSDGKTKRHIKVDGWYASYDGGWYDEWYEVFPKQKTVTVWTQGDKR